MPDDETLKLMISEMIQEVDYDIWKDRFNEETCEYGQDVDTNFDDMLCIVKEHLEE